MECPYMDENHPQCSLVLNLQHIGDAYALCNDRYHTCPVYKHLRKQEMEQGYVRSVEVIDPDRAPLLMRHG